MDCQFICELIVHLCYILNSCTSNISLCTPLFGSLPRQEKDRNLWYVGKVVQSPFKNIYILSDLVKVLPEKERILL